MPRSCTVCGHQDCGAIDHALATGAPNRRIAAQFNVSEQAIRCHKSGHLSTPAPAPALQDTARIGLLHNRIGMARAALKYLNEQLAEARASRAVAMLGGLTPGQQHRVRYEIESLTAERDSCAARLAELEAELAAHMK